MSDRDSFLRSIEHLRSQVGQVHRRLVELHDTAAFDPRLPNLPERAREIERQVQTVSGEAERLRARFKELHGIRSQSPPRRRKSDNRSPKQTVS
jgi:hypothetical protein